MGDEMIERELVEDIESRLGMVAHNLGAYTCEREKCGHNVVGLRHMKIDLEAAFKSWLTLRTKLQAAGVVSNVGGS
jgi:hypothetical protein